MANTRSTLISIVSLLRPKTDLLLELQILVPEPPNNQRE
jgi:hypothetical protein